MMPLPQEKISLLLLLLHRIKFIKHFKVRSQEVDWSHCILRLGPGDDECCNENKDIHHSDDEDKGED